ncbi:vitelline membrane protein Vm26Ab-like [Anopheles ziemanni]|uniref:vitelline membrane protein Vm26Ab-like n=1 Tax=Anopheles coustani TaxID=139045 RepID=UPI002659EDF5|nr:vitelline membrane protein Vm26Ab-like [Anopheles coustani]XP_058173004.1 vitelline membrane protein Vm26Ab-like [Anopheles ziemanni]
MFAKVIFVALLAVVATSAKPLLPLAYTAAAAPVVAAPAVSVASPYLASYAAPYTAAYTAPYAAAYTASPYAAAYSALPYTAALPYSAPYTSLVL